MPPPPKFEVDPTSAKAAFLDYNHPTLTSLTANNVFFDFSQFHVTAHLQVLFQIQDILAVFARLVTEPLTETLRVSYHSRWYGTPDILRLEWKGQATEIPESDEFWDALSTRLHDISRLDNDARSSNPALSGL